MNTSIIIGVILIENVEMTPSLKKNFEKVSI